MKKNNQGLILVVLLIALTSFAWNPLVSESLRLDVISQLQETFGGLFGGKGSLTIAKIISAITVIE